MKILFVSPVGAFFSGAEVAITNLMAYLASRGHRVYNVIPDNGAGSDQTYIDFMAQSGIELFQLPCKHWWWQEAHLVEDYEKPSIFAYQHQNITQVREIIQSESIDLVISNTINVFQGAFAAALEGVPHHVIIHEFPYGEFGYYKEKIPLIEALADKVFAVTGELFEDLSQYFSSEKLLPFIPYSHMETIELIESDTHRLVSIGGINPRKNQLELIQAYKELQDKSLELVFIGNWDQSYKKILDAYIEENGLDRIRFLGYQENPWQLLTNKDLLVLPSHQETFGLVYVEAVLNGLPIIVSNNLGHQTVYQLLKAGQLYQLGNKNQLAHTIQEFLDSFREKVKFARNYREDARELYTLNKTCDVFVQAIEGPLPYTSKPFVTGLASLLGWQVEPELLDHIAAQEIRVYHSNVTPYYQIDTYPYRKEDVIDILVGEADYIRIDFPEGLYQIAMYPDNLALSLIPVHSTAIATESGYLFLTEDNQVVYDTSTLHGSALHFHYAQVPLKTFDEELKQLIQDKQRLKAQLIEANNDLQSLISSRRWRYTTKLINLLRRKK
ncbi:glycosyltransferase family 4 protein [Streptococcus ovuberis]|uniref:Glycosyltransferase family 4 protein n=1 Tax=Streptococcus ovuberis TaxID=1936207 RepID=A0A7X6S0I8_9STRE|nr:glycosyltransferase family 4 protein [Streptococcus ovuberis]NKZ19370.1 glycosyltransferase family 4 protein [Streptococcus ovuberis]